MELTLVGSAGAFFPSRSEPVAGARLVREWQGGTHEVAVLSVGYEYRGRMYKSLSAIARTITGTRWNGPLFFGLRSGTGKEIAR